MPTKGNIFTPKDGVMSDFWKKNKENKEQEHYQDTLENFLKGKEEKKPIKRGCNNKQCFCTGKCEEIIGYE